MTGAVIAIFSFRLLFRDRRIQVRITSEEATYSLLEGEALEIAHHGRRLTLNPGKPAAEPPRATA